MLITVDGQSSTGKSSLAGALANRLRYQFLGSGSIYRLVAYALLQNEVPLEDFVQSLGNDLVFTHQSSEMRVILSGQDLTARLNEADVTKMASDIAKDPSIRQMLYPLQRQFDRAPGLVAEGRDMGTVIFPEAPIKFFLQADLEVRAKRRHKQLMKMGMDRSLDDLIKQLAQRDRQDETRSISPLISPEDAMILDTGGSWEDNLNQMYRCVVKTLPQRSAPKRLLDYFEEIKSKAYDLRKKQISGDDVSCYQWWRGLEEQIDERFGKAVMPGGGWLCPVYIPSLDTKAACNDPSVDDFYPPDYTEVNMHFRNQLMRIPMTENLTPRKIFQIALNVGQGLANQTVDEDFQITDFVVFSDKK